MPGYDGHCRDLNVVRSERTALRFKVPREGETIVHDAVRGDVVVSNSAIEDFVVARSNGAPLYLLANMVDDRLDHITHVIRGEDHISNTPKQILLWQALDEAEGVVVPLPTYAHLPLLVNEQRKKLSKRKDPVSVEAYRAEGYLPEAFVNFLGLLGWSPRGDQEKTTLEAMAKEFELSDVNHSPAYFDVAKLRNLNGTYIREMTPEAFLEAIGPWVDPASSWRPEGYDVPWPAERYDPAKMAAIAPAVHERVQVLSEVPAMVDFLFCDAVPMDEAAWAKAITGDPDASRILDAALEAYRDAAFAPEVLHEATTALGDALGLKLRKVQAPIRVAVTGKSVGPPLFESLVVLGRDEVLRRLEVARASLGAR